MTKSRACIPGITYQAVMCLCLSLVYHYLDDGLSRLSDRGSCKDIFCRIQRLYEDHQEKQSVSETSSNQGPHAEPLTWTRYYETSSGNNDSRANS